MKQWKGKTIFLDTWDGDQHFALLMFMMIRTETL